MSGQHTSGRKPEQAQPIAAATITRTAGVSPVTNLLATGGDGSASGSSLALWGLVATAALLLLVGFGLMRRGRR